MRSFPRICLVLLTLVCGCAASPAEAASSVAGSWVMRQSIPGNSFAMTLVANDTHLSGIGTFQGEAGPSGSLVVTGEVVGDQIALDFVLNTEIPFQSSREAHFVGHLVFGELHGTFQYGDLSSQVAPSSVVFVRVRPL